MKTNVKERLYDAVWSMGVRLRDTAKHSGLIGPLGPFLVNLGVRLIPAPSEEIEVILPSGMKMLVPPGCPWARSYASGVYERDVAAVFSSQINAGMSVAVVGANVGYHCLLASQLVGPAGRVYAFEPDPKIFSYLSRNIQINRCQNVVALEQAVSNCTGKAWFVPDARGGEGRLSRHAGHPASLTVQTVSLDDFFAERGWPQIQLIIMDVEGGEKLALDGMKFLSMRSQELNLILEVHTHILAEDGTSLETLAQTLRALGFSDGYVIGERPRHFTVDRNFPSGQRNLDLFLTSAPARRF